MKRNKQLERVLRADSGECTARLARRLAADKEAQRIREELDALRRELRAAEPDTSVSDFALEQIFAEARTALNRTPDRARRPTWSVFTQAWRPAFAYATLSVAVLLFGVYALIQFQEQAGRSDYAQNTPAEFADVTSDDSLTEWVTTLDESLTRVLADIDDQAWLTLPLDTEALDAELWGELDS